MYRISKRWTFDAAHQLDGLPGGHKCGRLHGHTYTVEVELSSDSLDENGFVVDFGDLAPIKHLIDTVLDHQFLNTRIQGNPTAENLARFLYERITIMLNNEDLRTSRLIITFGNGEKYDSGEIVPLRDGVSVTAVRVSETGSSWAEFRP